MPIDSKHPDYETAAPLWQRMRDVVAGEDAVHKAQVRYLPMLTEQKPEEYRAYVMRTPFFGATARTIDALHGLMFRKPPFLTMPAAMEEIAADVTMAGRTLDGFVGDIARECLSVGRVGVLVDFPRVEQRPVSMGQAQATGQRPFATLYKAEHVFFWRERRIGNKLQLVEARLHETYASPVDEWTEESRPQIRQLVLEEGAYVQRIFRQSKETGEWTLVEQIVPQLNGAPLRYIPFVILGSDAVSSDMAPPPLLDMANLNLSHYRSTADLEHGAHLTGLPMLFLAGIQLGEGEKVYVGSQSAVISPDPQADGKWIEFTGQGLEALEKRCEKKEQQMAALGARMLAPEKKAAEAGHTVEMRVGHETSMLADMAHVVSDASTKIMGWLRDWAGIGGEVRCQVNTDYVVAQLSAQDVTALVASWQQGAISKQTLFWNLQQGEVIEDGVTFEDEEARIGDAQPMLMSQDDGGG